MLTLDNKKYIIFDCDGVLLDSNSMKIDAFRKVAAPYLTCTEIEEYCKYVCNSFGKSRYVIIDHLINKYLLGNNISNEILLSLYAQYIQEDYITCNMTDGALEFVQKMFSKSKLYVVSGSDEKELQEVFVKRGINKYFQCIQGSPTAKKENLAQLLKDIPLEETVYIGDTMSDYLACVENDLDFIFMYQYSTISDENKAEAQNKSQRTIMNLMDLL